MRLIYTLVLLALAGCLATQNPHNPVKKTPSSSKKVVAEAPVKTKPATADAELSRTDLDIDRVELVKEMFLVQRDINHQILKLAEQLSQVELMDINLWLQQYGVQIKRKQVEKPKSPPRREVF